MGYEKFSYSFDGASNVLVTNWWGMKYLSKTTCNDSHLKLSDITLINANEHPDGESSDSDMDYDSDMDVKDIFTATSHFLWDIQYRATVKWCLCIFLFQNS